MKKLFALAAILVASASTFGFQPRMFADEVEAEVRLRMSKGESLNGIADAGKTGGVQTGVMACALVGTGSAPADVVAAMVRGGFVASEVVNGAICKGASREALARAAIDAGADPTALLSATAAGGQPAAGQEPAGGGFNGSNFGGSRASTLGGGGRSSVSRS